MEVLPARPTRIRVSAPPASEEACRDYLALRWPEGFRCPRCGHERDLSALAAGKVAAAAVVPGEWITTLMNGASALLQRVLGRGRTKPPGLGCTS